MQIHIQQTIGNPISDTKYWHSCYAPYFPGTETQLIIFVALISLQSSLEAISIARWALSRLVHRNMHSGQSFINVSLKTRPRGRLKCSRRWATAFCLLTWADKEVRRGRQQVRNAIRFSIRIALPVDTRRKDIVRMSCRVLAGTSWAIHVYKGLDMLCE